MTTVSAPPVQQEMQPPGPQTLLERVAQRKQHDKTSTRKPENDPMLLRWRPDGKAIDWDAWQRTARPPARYNPPQLRPAYLNKLRNCICFNWHLPRTPLCAWPCVPCCCVTCLYGCCHRSRKEVQLSNPDEWFMDMLSTGTHKNCPERLQGIWWMQDNHAHEVIATFHDMDWKTQSLGLKTMQYNWARQRTLWGAASHTVHKLNGSTVRVEISPDGKWINMSYPNGGFWMYVVQPNDAFTLPDGTFLDVTDGEMMRLSYAEELNPLSDLTYQYRLRRVAYLNDKGKLVKTASYNALLTAATAEQPQTGLCYGQGYCLCCLSDDKLALNNFTQLDDSVVVTYAPPPPKAQRQSE